MPKAEKPYKLDESRSFTWKQIQKQNKNDQVEIMKNWFYGHYEDPVMSCPYISSEGGYQYIYGGPYDAHDELCNEFLGVVSEEIIIELADHLNDKCGFWSGLDSGLDRGDDYYWERYLEIVSLIDTDNVFDRAIKKLNKMLEVNVPLKLKQNYYKLLYTHAITLLEAYLFETFIKLITGKGEFSFKYIILNNFKQFKNKPITRAQFNDQKIKIDRNNIKYFTSGFSCPYGKHV